MALTHMNVTQSSQSLLALKTEPSTSLTAQRNSVRPVPHRTSNGFDPARVLQAATPPMDQGSQSIGHAPHRSSIGSDPARVLQAALPPMDQGSQNIGPALHRSSIGSDPARVPQAASSPMEQESQPSAFTPESSNSSPQDSSEVDVAAQSTRLAAQTAKEKSDADLEKQLLLENLSSIASPEIQQRINITEKKLAKISLLENIRKQSLDDALLVMRDQLASRLALEREEQEILDMQRLALERGEQEILNMQRLALEREEQEILDMQRECKMQLTKHVLQPRLSSALRNQSRLTLMSHLERLGTCLNKFKEVDPTSKKVHEVAVLLQAVSAAVDHFTDFENRVDSALNEINSIKVKFSAKEFSLDEAAALSVRYQQMMSQEESMTLSAVASSAESPEVQDAINKVLDLCKEMEVKADNEAVAFVQAGSSLCKYAREKVIKKSRHDPVASIVKIASEFSLLWGSHKSGPRILELSLGPSQMLVDSGLLGHR